MPGADFPGGAYLNMSIEVIMNRFRTQNKAAASKEQEKSYITKRLQTGTNNESQVDRTLIAQRWLVTDTMASIRNLLFYTVSDTMTPEYCGACGAENSQNTSQYCHDCGFFLNDSRFLLIEGDHESTKVFDFITQNNIHHESLISTLVTYQLNGKRIILATPMDHTTLRDITADISTQLLYKIAYKTLQAIQVLHDHSIFNFGLKPDHIFIKENNPIIVDLSDAVIQKGGSERWRQADIKSFGDEFLKILSKTEIKDDHLKQIFFKAAQRQFQSIEDIKRAFSQLKQQTETTDNLPESEYISDHQGNIAVGESSNVGQVRTLNEDSIASLNMTYIHQSKSKSVGLYIVADGMGGHDAGEEASKIAVQLISQSIMQQISDWNKVTPAVAKIVLEECMYKANDAIYQLSQSRKNDMGTTVTIALLLQPDLYILNVGDGRAYHFQNNKLELITSDHSLVYRLYKMGQISYSEIRNHPQANQIISALGEPDLNKNLTNLEINSNHSYFFHLSIKKGDGLLLCSDGLWQMIPEDKIEMVLAESSHPQQATDALVQLANQNGGDDNISLIYVKTY